MHKPPTTYLEKLYILIYYIVLCILTKTKPTFYIIIVIFSVLAVNFTWHVFDGIAINFNLLINCASFNYYLLTESITIIRFIKTQSNCYYIRPKQSMTGNENDYLQKRRLFM